MKIICSLEANPVHYEGPAPVTVQFTGKIEIQDQTTEEVEIKYHFIRSDGGIDKNIRSLKVHRPGGVYPVATYWKLSPPNYTGWVAIEVLSPQHQVSNHAGFSVKCSPVDLAVFNYTKDFDMANHKIWIGAEISNNSSFDVKGPFDIEVGAGAAENLSTVSRIYTIPGTVTIAKNGGTYSVPRVIELDLYRNTEYWIEIRLDPENALHEANRENNVFKAKWHSV